MVDVHLIRTEADHAAALSRVESLITAEAGTREGDDLELLATLIEVYEEKHHAIDLPDPIAAIAFRMEQEELTSKDLIPCIGSSAKVSEVLSGKRDLTLSMIRALNKHLGIPAEVLIQEPGGTIPENNESIDWSRFPVVEMAKRGFIEARHGVKKNAEPLMRDLIEQAGGCDIIPMLVRKGDCTRRNAKMNSYALMALCIYVLAEARRTKPTRAYEKGTITAEFLREVAKLSARESGPKLAQEFLSRHGIVLVVAPQLASTYLDGVAIWLEDGTPVVGMTLRYDRLDSFWFCLLHELSHIGCHMEGGDERIFVDDLDLRTKDDDPLECEADSWAEDALIPPRDWAEYAAQDLPTPGNVISLAQRVDVHPAVVAGRVRRKHRNTRMLTQLVGNGEVRKHFEQRWN